MRVERGTAGIGAALVVLGLLTACTPAAPAAPVERASVSPAVASVDEEPQPVVLDPGTVVATGELKSLDGLSSGHVSVVSAADGEFDLVIDDFVSPITNLVVNVTSEPFTEAGYCAQTQIIYVLNTTQPAPRLVARIGEGDYQLMDDPSFLDTVLLTVNEADAPRTGCFYSVFASTELDWTMPDLRPDLVVADTGYTGGATGLVEMHGERIGSYTVAAGDVFAEIAARFDITVDDLLYLNPGRIADGDPALAFVDEVFNLDTETR